MKHLLVLLLLLSSCQEYSEKDKIECEATTKKELVTTVDGCPVYRVYIPSYGIELSTYKCTYYHTFLFTSCKDVKLRWQSGKHYEDNISK